MSTGPGGGYMMSNCGSVYSITADGGVCVERGATLLVYVSPCTCAFYLCTIAASLCKSVLLAAWLVASRKSSLSLFRNPPVNLITLSFVFVRLCFAFFLSFVFLSLSC